MSISNLRIAQKLPLLIIVSSLILALSIGFLGYFQGAGAVDQEVQKKLEVVFQSRKNALESYLDSIQDDLDVTAASPLVASAIQDFSAGWSLLGDTPKDALQKAYIRDNQFPAGEKEKLDFAKDGSMYSLAHRKYHPWFRKALNTREYYDIFLLDLDGNLIYTVFKEQDYATNMNRGEWRQSGLATAYRAALAGAAPGRDTFVDFAPYAPSAGAPASFIATPVYADGKLVGVLAYQMSISKLNAVMQNNTGLGETGESFLVGSDFLMRSDSRFSEDSTILKREIKNEPTKAAIAGESGVMTATDYLGDVVKAVYGPVKFLGTTWAIVAEMDEDEYAAPVYSMRNIMAVTALLLLLAIGAIGVYFARTIGKSLASITEAMKNLAGGNLEVEVPSLERTDEISDMAQALQVFKEGAQEQKRLEEEAEVAAKEAEEAAKEAAIVANENARIKAALDNCSTNMMVADADYTIIYVNETMKEMLHNNEADMRKDLPQFDAKSIIGTNIDGFHVNPAHQRGMLDRLTSSYTANITIGGRFYSLIASPVIDDEGERIGTIVEWADVTAERNIESEIDTVVTAAVAGDFSSRLNLEDKEGFMLNLSKSINSLSETISNAMEDISTSLSALAAGDLARRIDTAYQGLFDTLKTNANGTAEQLTEIVGDISTAASEVTNAAQEINEGTMDLSQRTEQQASNLEETAAAMEEMSSTVKQNAENAQQANQLSVSARDVAEKGGDVVGEVVNAMTRIEDSSQKISDIIGVIDEIAFQTNLLALNAAVEAARAGDAGKGFAVVAAEVGTLAQRSSQAAKDIKGLINDSGNQVKDGVRLVGDAGESLTEIVDSIKRLSDIVSEIAAASEEQSTSISEINRSVAQMDEMTQQNSALVEENAAASRTLQEQSEAMKERISFFSIDDSSKQNANGSARMAPTVSPTVSAAPAPQKPAPSPQPMTMSAVSAGGAAAAEDWSEF